MPEANIYDPDLLTNRVLRGLAIALTVLAIVLSALNIYLEQYSLAVFEWGLALACIFVYFQIERHKLTFLQSLIVPYFLAIVVIFGTVGAPVQNGLYLWTLILPTIFYLLYGRDHGFWATLIIGVIQLINILSKDSSAFYEVERIATNFALAYLTLWVVSRAYEINRKKAQLALQQLALKDSLTQAYNRLGLKQYFRDAVKSSNLSLVMLDIDFFKKINDDYGHEAGDQILQQVTQLMQKIAGEQSVFRLGGEEFCLLLQMPKAEAANIAEECRVLVESSVFHYKNDTLKCTFSGGVAGIGGKADKDLSQLLAEADKKLYQAKHNGRNQIVVD
ncbi:GGDEF domain-containing protein [Thiomicrorhabdus sediminis]|uniref:diguanylate cyclase n=1 Tax=Thiomicrorhabdus sediminis TaxID=2580412 RepID=A0A4P9K385_9GAMM|nr:GGDEF domain-containing protein [Thiomicrorhabdus sediminis]QCU89309.1 GGDEF domain-containing protein [Thiomicrorhabdus sediminis]